MRFVLAPILVCTLAATSQAQRCWGQSSAAGSVAPQYTWVQSSRDADQVGLFRRNLQIGVWSIEKQQYNPLIRGTWGKTTEPPINPPEWALTEKEPKPVFNFGIKQPTPVQDDGEHIQLGEKEITRAEFLRELDKPQDSAIPDDTNKFRLIVTTENRAAVEKDLANEPKEFRDKVALWSVAPDHWSLKDNTTGKPLYPNKQGSTVCLMSPPDKSGRGKIVYFEPDYRGPSDIQAMRKAVESFEGKTFAGRNFTGAAASFGSAVGGSGLTLLLLALYRRKHAPDPVH